MLSCNGIRQWLCAVRKDMDTAVETDTHILSRLTHSQTINLSACMVQNARKKRTGTIGEALRLTR